MTTYLRGSFVTRQLNRLVAALGLKPVLATRGRKSGQWRTLPVNVLEVEGARYLVSTRGDAFWVRNLNHDPVAELRRRGRAERVRATPVPVAERPRLIEAYLARWKGEAATYFEQLPDPADHPIYRLEPA